MKYIVLVAIIALTGCQSLQYAGSSSYQIRQITDANGKAGFDISVKNGKEVASVKAHLVKDGERIEIDLEETGVAAFAGQQIAAGAIKIAAEQAAKAAVAAALGMATGGALPAVASALEGGGLPAAVVGAGGALVVRKALSKPDPAPVEVTP